MAIYKGSNNIKHAYYRGTEYTSIHLGGLAIFSPSVIVYRITCDLENVTSNAPSSVESGDPLTVVLTGVDGNKVQENSVIVTMGGNDITSTAYNHATKTVSIAEVTGNVSITAVGRPYDAEVEWLQSDGAAYIDIGIKASNAITFDVTVNLPTGGVAAHIFGSRVAYGSSQIHLQQDTNGFTWRLYSYTTSTTAVKAPGTFNFKNTTATRTLVINDSTSLSVTAAGTFSNNYNIYIFALNNAGNATVSGNPPKLLSAKFYSSGTLIRDYIPVRKDGVGYLYDKVSEQLFGNANSSGAFTYGNDV